jgi:hypothetical protein
LRRRRHPQRRCRFSFGCIRRIVPHVAGRAKPHHGKARNRLFEGAFDSGAPAYLPDVETPGSDDGDRSHAGVDDDLDIPVIELGFGQVNDHGAHARVDPGETADLPAALEADVTHRGGDPQRFLAPPCGRSEWDRGRQAADHGGEAGLGAGPPAAHQGLSGNGPDPPCRRPAAPAERRSRAAAAPRRSEVRSRPGARRRPRQHTIAGWPRGRRDQSRGLQSRGLQSRSLPHPLFRHPIPPFRHPIPPLCLMGRRRAGRHEPPLRLGRIALGNHIITKRNRLKDGGLSSGLARNR